MAATTALDLIKDSMEMGGIINPEDPLSDAMAARGLSVLNDMLDMWSNESLACYTILEQTAQLVPGKTAYTIGIVQAPLVADIALTRPLRIIDDYGSAYVLDNNQNRYPMDVVGRSYWNMITTSLLVDSNVPDKLFYDPQYPLGVINIWPTPNIGYPFFWDSYLQLAEFSALTTPFSFPPGYKRAIVSNLTIQLYPYYRDKEPSNTIIMIASESKAAIKRTNIRQQIAIYDPEIVARGNATYNIYRDSYGRQG